VGLETTADKISAPDAATSVHQQKSQEQQESIGTEEASASLLIIGAWTTSVVGAASGSGMISTLTTSCFTEAVSCDFPVAEGIS